MRACQTQRRGFTLIELLVVIGIISVLMGLVMAAVTGVGRTHKSKVARADLTRLKAGIQEYVTLYNEGLPLAYEDLSNGQIICEDLIYDLQNNQWFSPTLCNDVHPSSATQKWEMHVGYEKMDMKLLMQMLIKSHPLYGYRKSDGSIQPFEKEWNCPRGLNTNLNKGNLFIPREGDRFDREGYWLDPWGNRYVFQIDIVDFPTNGDPDGCWDYRSYGGGTPQYWPVWNRDAVYRLRVGGETLLQQVWMYSFGPDGQSDNGYSPYQDGHYNEEISFSYIDGSGNEVDGTMPVLDYYFGPGTYTAGDNVEKQAHYPWDDLRPQ